ELGSPGALARAADKLREPERAEHLAVSRSPEVDRKLRAKLLSRFVARLQRYRHPDRQVRGRAPGSRRLAVDDRANGANALGRDEVEDDLVGVSRGDARHRGTERRHRDARPGLRAAETEAVGAHLPTVVCRRLAGEDL